MKNEAHTLSGIMMKTHELPTIKKMTDTDNDSDFFWIRLFGIIVASALSMIQFAYF